MRSATDAAKGNEKSPAVKSAPAVVPANAPEKFTPGVAESTDDKSKNGLTGTLYLRDLHGKYVPVPEANFEEFLRRNDPRKLAERTNDRPAATLQQLSLVGKALKQAAALNAVFEIRIHDSGREWLRIPLGLREAAWKPASSTKATASISSTSTAKPTSTSVGCALENTKHTITASIVAPIVGAGQERRLALGLPDAAASVLRLDVTGGRVSVIESRGTPEADVRVLDGQTSRIETLGVKGNYVLAWRESDRSGDAIQPILEATCLQCIRIDGRTISTQARLTVRSFGAEFDRIRVRIPQKSVLAGLPGKGMTLSTVPGTNGETIEVLLDAKTLGPLEIPLQTERVLDVNKPNDPLELAGFEVLEALPHRQGGTVGVETLGDWQLLWGKMARVRAAVDFPDKTSSVVPGAIWEYVGQPYQLEVRVQPRRTLLTGDIEHRLRCFENHAELTTTLKYQVRGARLNVVSLQLHGWTIEEIGPESIVNRSALLVNTGDPLQIPLNAPTLGNFELVVRARRGFTDEKNEHALQLPTAVVDQLGSARLNVAATDQIQIEPLVDRCLNMKPARENSPGAIVDDSTWNFRVEKQPVTFAFRIVNVPKRVDGLVLAKCVVGQRGVKVTQRLEYRVANGTLDQVVATTPGSLPGQTAISWSIDEKPIVPRGLPRYDEIGKVWVWTLPVETPRRDGVTLQADYTLPYSLGVANTTALTLPMVLPQVDKLLRQEAHIEPDAGVVVGTTKLTKPWKLLDVSSDIERVRPFDLRSTTPQSEIDLTAELQPAALGSRMIVEHTWMQTWLSDNERLERIVYRIRGDTGPAHIELPEHVSPNDVQMVWNRETLRFQIDGLRTLSPIYPTSSYGEQILELRYRYNERPSLWSVDPRLPRWDPAVWDGRFYWQILTPDRWLLVRGPSDMNDENPWRLDDEVWGRIPTLDEARLEVWSGGEPGNARPSGSHTYLFGAVGSRIDGAVWLMPRTLVVWIGTAFGFGLAALIRWRSRVLNATGLLGASALMFLLGVAFPDQLLLFGQFALFGIPLLAIAMLLRRLLGSSDAAIVLKAESSDQSSAEPSNARNRRPDHVRTGSTATALLAGSERPSS
ncbi:MAG: hypothetical protein QM811_14310 [Pirellulales bacterium]